MGRASVGIASYYEAGRSDDRIPVGARYSATVKPSLLYNGYRVCFSWVKRIERGVNHPPWWSAEIKERVDLYFRSPSGPSSPVLGRTLHFLQCGYHTLHFLQAFAWKDAWKKIAWTRDNSHVYKTSNYTTVGRKVNLHGVHSVNSTTYTHCGHARGICRRATVMIRALKQGFGSHEIVGDARCKQLCHDGRWHRTEMPESWRDATRNCPQA